MGRAGIVIVLIAVVIALAMVPGTRVSLLDPGVELGPEDPEAEAGAPSRSGPGRVQSGGPGRIRLLPNSTHGQDRGERRLDLRAQAIRSRRLGFVRLSVRDAASGRPLRAFRYRLYGPGTEPKARQVEGHEAEVGLRVGMPSNLLVEADGYAPVDLRQIQLTERDRFRRIEVRLKPARRR
ncbi:MAG: hypothetical protein ACE5F1_05255 [Planctomycetota bacterium]